MPGTAWPSSPLRRRFKTLISCSASCSSILAISSKGSPPVPPTEAEGGREREGGREGGREGERERERERAPGKKDAAQEDEGH